MAIPSFVMRACPEYLSKCQAQFQKNGIYIQIDAVAYDDEPYTLLAAVVHHLRKAA